MGIGFRLKSIWLRSLGPTSHQVGSHFCILSILCVPNFEIDPGIALASQEISDGDLLPQYNTTVSLKQSGRGRIFVDITRVIHFQDHLYGRARSDIAPLNIASIKKRIKSVCFQS